MAALLASQIRLGSRFGHWRCRGARESINGKRTVRCSNEKCLSLFPEEADMSDAQKKHKTAGERLCQRCAEE
eukprot:9217271-Pyramimonas_sp.AAC.1